MKPPTARAVSPAVIAVAIAVNLAVVAIAWSPVRAPLVELGRATGGWASTTLVTSLVGLAIDLAILVGLGRLALRDVGLDVRKLPGVAVVVAVWAIAQLAAIALGGARLDPGAHTGILVGQVFGNALEEEVVFRGFLMVQLMLLARRPWLGVVASQLVFAVMHVPQRLIVEHAYGPELAGHMVELFAFGLVFAAVYLRTRNLWVAIAVHALVNEPYVLFDDGIHVFQDRVHLVHVLLPVILVVWPYLPRRLRD